MIEFGFYLLLFTFLVAIYGLVANGLGAYTEDRALLESGKRSILALFICTTLAVIALEYLLLTKDFRVEYVAHYTSLDLPLMYSISALWGGQSGSLLFWAWVLSGFCLLSRYLYAKDGDPLFPTAAAVSLGILAFFVGLITFVVNPFDTLSVPPENGRGLNPLLQNPYMVAHPPTLYLGYIGFTIPFAFAMAALITGQLSDAWIQRTRRWNLVIWLVLSIGITLGGHWAYLELGWGGYWAWDPVENASFLPWLTATALLHSVLIQERRKMLKRWNMILVMLTFLLSIFGTFITRSGLISSVHSFTESPLFGSIFLGFLSFLLVFSVSLLLYRWRDLQSENSLESFFSKESSFLFNNLLLVGLCFTILLGTLWPIISEAVRGVRITVGPPFFNTVTSPLFLTLLLLTGIGPLIAWRKSSWQNFRKNFLIPSSAAILAGVGLFVMGIRQIYPMLAYLFSIFIVGTVILECYRGVTARRRLVGENAFVSLYNLFRRNSHRYGGYIVHLGIVMVAVGITASSAFKLKVETQVPLGESFQIGRYTLIYENMQQLRPNEDKEVVRAVLRVENNGHPIDTLHPEIAFFRNWEDQPTTEVALRSGLTEDLYAVLAAWSEDGESATFQVFVNPLVQWIWYGLSFFIGGIFITLLPDPWKHKR